MKRLAAVIAVLCLLVCLGAAAAEGIDLAGLSDEELLGLMAQVQEEIVDRHIAGTADFFAGTYIAGRELPAGSYIFLCKATGSQWGNMTIYSEQGEGSQKLWKVLSAPEDGEEPESFFITLEENDELRSDVPFSLTIYAGPVFQ